jgi:hypothetical protein
MHSLQGKIIYSVDISEDFELLRFTTNAGDIYFHTQNDCCNSVYFNHLK